MKQRRKLLRPYKRKSLRRTSAIFQLPLSTFHTLILVLYILTSFNNQFTSAQDVESNEIDQTSNDIINPDDYRKNDQYHYLSQSNSLSNEFTEISETTITGEKTLSASKSPYLLRMDLDVEKNGKLIVEPGVVVHFAPMVGITVRGVLKAIVSIF